MAQTRLLRPSTRTGQAAPNPKIQTLQDLKLGRTAKNPKIQTPLLRSQAWTGDPKTKPLWAPRRPFDCAPQRLRGKGLALCGRSPWVVCLQGSVASQRAAREARVSKARAARVRARAQRSFDLSLGRLVWTAAAGLAEAKARLDCPELGSR